MLPLWTKSILLFPVIVMALQDFRSRKISVIALVLFAIGAVCYECLSVGVVDMLIGMGLNMGLLLFMLSGVVLWVLISKKGTKKTLISLIGLGDVLFMMALTPLFGLREFVYFLLTSMVAGLVWWSIMIVIKQSKSLTIPLVGVMGSVCIIWIVTDIIYMTGI